MHKQARLFQGVAFLISAIILGLSIVSYLWLLPPEIPLFYSMYGLQSQLAAKEAVFYIPGLSIGFSLLSVIIVRSKHLDDTGTVLHSLGTMIIVGMLLLVLIRMLFLVLP